ncbi:MAG: transposase [Dehalococcoidia bacterium]|nr:transposase [Dehalococcoidia bacterium]
MAVSVPPSMALSEFIRQVKGSSVHFMNHELAAPITFRWQAEYGLISFDRKQPAGVVRYVREQGTHHAQRTTMPTPRDWGKKDEQVRPTAPCKSASAPSAGFVIVGHGFSPGRDRFLSPFLVTAGNCLGWSDS